MNHSKEYNKCNDDDIEHKSRRNVRRYSYEIKKGKLKVDTISIKNKFKKIEKNKFKNIPKNDKLMNFSTILHNDKNNEAIQTGIKEKNDCDNLVRNLYLNNNRFDITNINKKGKENNLKLSSLIPISKKRINKSKNKTIKEKDNLIYIILKKEKKKTSKRKRSVNNDDSKCSKCSRISKHSKSSKKNKKKYNSSQAIIKVKKNCTKNFEDIIKKETKEKNKNKEEIIKNDIKNLEIKKEINEINADIKHNNNNNNKKSIGKEKGIIDINSVRTKNDCNIIKITNKENKKKHMGFPLCCFTINDNNSSDNE